MGFGRKFTKRTFLALSPNKTWEGFVGGGVCTVIFAFIFPVALVHMKARYPCPTPNRYP